MDIIFALILIIATIAAIVLVINQDNAQMDDKVDRVVKANERDKRMIEREK